MQVMSRPMIPMMERERFSPTEVGITHQFTNAFVRLTDGGDAEMVASEGCAIVLHPQNKSITLVADKIKFITKEHGGMQWNNMMFNEKATKFSEPALYNYDPEDGKGIFRNIHDFLEDPE